MKLITSLMMMIAVSGVLVVETNAQNARDLVDHPSQANIMDRDQLLQNLKWLKMDYPEPSSDKAEYVAQQLYRTKDKPLTELYNGVTVQRLIEENRIDLEGCSEKAFSKRSELYLRTRPFGTQSKGVDFGINLYALTVLRSAVKYCLENKAAVVRGSINSEEYLQKLADANKKEIDEWKERMDLILDEEVLNELMINGAYMSKLAGAIEGTQRKASQRELRMRTLGRRIQYYFYQSIPFQETGFYYT